MAQTKPKRVIRNPQISTSYVPPSVRRKRSNGETRTRYRWNEMKPYKKNGKMVYPSVVFTGGDVGRRAVDAAHHWAKNNGGKFESETLPNGSVRIYRIK